MDFKSLKDLQEYMEELEEMGKAELCLTSISGIRYSLKCWLSWRKFFIQGKAIRPTFQVKVVGKALVLTCHHSLQQYAISWDTVPEVEEYPDLTLNKPIPALTERTMILNLNSYNVGDRIGRNVNFQRLASGTVAISELTNVQADVVGRLIMLFA